VVHKCCLKRTPRWDQELAKALPEKHPRLELRTSSRYVVVGVSANNPIHPLDIGWAFDLRDCRFKNFWFSRGSGLWFRAAGGGCGVACGVGRGAGGVRRSRLHVWGPLCMRCALPAPCCSRLAPLSSLMPILAPCPHTYLLIWITYKLGRSAPLPAFSLILLSGLSSHPLRYPGKTRQRKRVSGGERMREWSV
jgi:hypothetical protein